MKSQAKERIYMIVTIVCLLMCAVLLLSVFLDRPVFGVQSADHVPVMRPMSAEEISTEENEGSEDAVAPDGGFVLTEEDLASAVQSSLPASFPVSSVESDIDESGEVSVAMKVKRSDLEKYLKDAGVSLTFRQSLAVKLLPKTFEFEVRALISCADGNVTITPLSTTVNDGTVTFKSLPSGILDMINAGLSTALTSVGYEFTTIIFTDGSMILQ